MTADRLKVRLAYQRGWQVVDGSTILATFDNEEAAFRHLVERGARVKLSWGRTIIGGKEAPLDFAASFQSKNAGRIMKELHGPSAGTWWWYCGSRVGNVETKDQAVFEVERAYTRRIAKADWPKTTPTTSPHRTRSG